MTHVFTTQIAYWHKFQRWASLCADLDQLVPASRHDDGVGGHWGEADAGHPLRVTIGLGNGVLALADGVPQLDGLVA